MKVNNVTEYGHREALLGLSFNKKQDVGNMSTVAKVLAGKGGGHDKFLRQICVWIDCNAPLYWWKQFDQYGFKVTQSESSMHTLMKLDIVSEDFEGGMDESILTDLNHYRLLNDFKSLNQRLPHSYLQRRMISTNYGQLDTIFKQRKNHKIGEWKIFLSEVYSYLHHPELIKGFEEK